MTLPRLNMIVETLCETCGSTNEVVTAVGNSQVTCMSCYSPNCYVSRILEVPRDPDRSETPND
jgi:hypothetical protein